MNKLLIVLLAVCLVSVQAGIAKRDAEVENKQETNYLGNFQTEAKKFADNISKKASETFDPETIKKGLNDALATIQKALNDLKSTTGGAAEPNKAA